MRRKFPSLSSCVADLSSVRESVGGGGMGAREGGGLFITKCQQCEQSAVATVEYCARRN